MKNILAFAFLLCSLRLAAQDISLYQKKEYTNSDGKLLSYRVLYPENYDKSIKYPVILFLHGAGERGNDNETQLTHGAKLFLADSNRKNFPCIVIFPQCPKESYWSSAIIDRSVQPLKISFNYDSSTVMWPLASAIEVLKQTVQNESVDKSRIYIMGLSMGGMGTFEAAYRYNNLFAAAMPVCGGGDVAHYDKRVKKIPFRVFHGDADAVVNVELSRTMVAKLKEIGADVTYTEYPGVNHNSWDNAFAEPTYLSWLFSHKRKNVKL